MKRRYWVTLALLFTLGGPSIMAQSTTACKLNPTNRTVTICTPEGRSSTSPVESPVRVVAGCADSTPISIIQIYIDGQKVTQFSSNQIDMTIPMASGNNNISVLCKDSSGAFFSTHVNTAVSGGCVFGQGPGDLVGCLMAQNCVPIAGTFVFTELGGRRYCGISRRSLLKYRDYTRQVIPQR